MLVLSTLLVFIQVSRSLSDILISNLDQKDGITISSQTSPDLLGYYLNKAGDFNDDGYDDVIIAAFSANSQAGAVYVIFGNKDGLSDLTVPSEMNPNLGLIIYGANAGDQLGRSVSYAGDVNDDGIDDIIIGASEYQSKKGIAYVIYGSKSPPAIINLALGLNPNQGFAVIGKTSNDFLGTSVSWAGDVNNDKIDDIIIGADGVSSARGAAFVIFGKQGIRSDIFVGSGLAPTEGFAIIGETDADSLGHSVSYAGDLDGDGIGDVIIGASGYSGLRGAAYVIFGQDAASYTFGTIDLNAGMSPSEGVAITGWSSMSQFGASVGCAGDFNDDGVSDVIVGATGENSFRGAVYVIFGNDQGSFSDLNLNSGLDPSRFVRFMGSTSTGSLGMSVNGAGDINGDGVDDLIMGEPQGGAGRGVAYVIFGSKNPDPDTAFSAGLDSAKGFSITGANGGDYLGFSTCGAGDVNGDGMSDLLVGAYGANSIAGAAYILFTPPICLEKYLTCSDIWTCDTCKTGYGLYHSQCVICPSPTKLDNGICIIPPKSSLETATEISKGLFDSGSVASRIFTLGRSLSVSLGLMAKIIQNVRFLDIDYPVETLNAFKTYGTDLFELPIPEVFYESPETKGLPIQYSRYDVNPTFLENYWQTIIMILMTLGGFLVIRVIQYFTRSQNKEYIVQVILKNIGQTTANFFIIQLYSSLDDVIFFFVLDAGSTRMSSASSGISMSAAGLFLLLGCVLILFHCWVLGKYQQAKKDDEKFRIVGTLYEDFKDDSAVKQSFFGILILRCVFLVLVIMLLQPPWIQASLLMGANLVFLGYLIYQRPFKSRFDEVSQYFCELTVFAAYLGVLVLSILDYKEDGSLTVRNGFGKCIVIAGIVLCLGGFILQMIQTIGAIIEISKFFKNYYRKAQVAPEEKKVSDKIYQDSESSNIMKSNPSDQIELINLSYRNKIIPLALEKLQCSGSGLEVSFANSDNPPVLERTSKKKTDYNQRNPLENGDGEFGTLRTQNFSHYFRGQRSELVLNMESEIPPQTNVKRRNKKFKKKERQPNLSVLHDHANT